MLTGEQAWLGPLLACCRVLPLTLSAPALVRLPVSVRLSLGAALAVGIADVIAPAPGPPGGVGVWLVMRELALGVVLAIAAQWPLWAFRETALLAAKTVELEHAKRSLVHALELTAAATFVALGGMRAVMRGLLSTYQAVPWVSTMPLDSAGALTELLATLARVVSLSLALALPLLLSMLSIELVRGWWLRGLGLAAVSAPRSVSRALLAWILGIALLLPLLEQLPPLLRTAASGLAGLAGRLVHH